MLLPDIETLDLGSLGLTRAPGGSELVEPTLIEPTVPAVGDTFGAFRSRLEAAVLGGARWQEFEGAVYLGSFDVAFSGSGAIRATLNAVDSVPVRSADEARRTALLRSVERGTVEVAYEADDGGLRVGTQAVFTPQQEHIDAFGVLGHDSIAGVGLGRELERGRVYQVRYQDSDDAVRGVAIPDRGGVRWDTPHERG